MSFEPETRGQEQFSREFLTYVNTNRLTDLFASVVVAAVTTAGGTAVPSRVLSRANDPIFASMGVYSIALNESYILPTVALAKGSTYTVTVTGDSNGASFTKAFTFTPSLQCGNDGTASDLGRPTDRYLPLGAEAARLLNALATKNLAKAGHAFRRSVFKLREIRDDD